MEPNAAILPARKALEELCEQKPVDAHKIRVSKIIPAGAVLSLSALLGWAAHKNFELPSESYNLLSLEGFRLTGNFLQDSWESIAAGASSLGLLLFGLHRLADAASTYTPISLGTRQNGPIYFKDGNGGGFMLNPWLLRRFFSRKVHEISSAYELEKRMRNRKSLGFAFLDGISITGDGKDLSKVVKTRYFNATFNGVPIRINFDYYFKDEPDGSTNWMTALERSGDSRFYVVGELHKEDKQGYWTKRSDAAYAVDAKYIGRAITGASSAQGN